jgi:putative isomerase
MTKKHKSQGAVFTLLLTILFSIFVSTSDIFAQLPAIDLNNGIFSCRGSYLSFTCYRGRDNKPGDLTLMSITRRPQRIDLFSFVALKDGREVSSTITATPSVLTILTADGEARICFQDSDVFRIQIRNIGLRMKPPQECRLMQVDKNVWRYQAEWTERFLITSLAGNFISSPTVADKPQNLFSSVTFDILPDKNGNGELALEYYLSQSVIKKVFKPFDDCVKDKARQFNKWLATMPIVADNYKPTMVKAAFTNWSSLVYPRENFSREGMLMSKMWMNAIWSWDHCFNAMALGYSNPQLAFDQLMVVFDKQNKIGALPDDTYEYKSGWGYLKPPIHGWTLRCMMEKSKSISPAMIAEIYKPLANWTNFYFNYRDDNRNGLAESHHGNDSGADNATIFDDGMPVDDPALNSYLIIQMDVLAGLAKKLGKPEESDKWTLKADKLMKLLIDSLWDGNKFVARQVYSRHINDGAYCHLRFMPLMLARRLPDQIRQKLIADLKETLIAPNGIATEGPKSAKFVNTGYSYWRGPIWAPTTYMLIDALDRCGEKALAKELALKFCDMCSREGFAENFDPISGKGLCDPCYTWTSSVFILLAHEYGK